MSRTFLPLAAALLLVSCQSSETKVLIGATTISAPGAAPIEDSVIVVSGHTIRAIGIRKDVPIPQDSERTALTGSWVTPGNGGRLEAGGEADLAVHSGSATGPVTRRLWHGVWTAAE
jgi:hypothetical protein